ncbi:sortase family protein, LPXTG-site transpeptidase [Actinobacteria bacterium IMCC26207]|nr:sortase family protein, LPXTG-site transpeptidase [Actinobacteria bacterium IMCC26207]
MTDVIDLRPDPDETEPSSVDFANLDSDQTDEVDQAVDPAASLKRRRIILAVIASLVVLVAADAVIGAAVHAEHQRHLAAEFAIPTEELAVGDAAFVLQIPALGINEVVVEGASASELRGGPGRRLDSVQPGDSGNTVIQGHKTRFGGPFGQLKDLKGGNSIYLRSRSGEVTVYKVTKVRKVGSDQVKYLEFEGPNRLTLVSSAGGPLDGSRVVVTAAADDLSLTSENAGDTAGKDGAAAEAAPTASAEDEGAPIQTYDVRGLGGAVLLLTGIGLIAVGILVGFDLKKKYGWGAVLLVAGSSVALGVIVLLFNISMVVPTTY